MLSTPTVKEQNPALEPNRIYNYLDVYFMGENISCEKVRKLQCKKVSGENLLVQKPQLK